jgi:hypothetical protein
MSRLRLIIAALALAVLPRTAFAETCLRNVCAPNVPQASVDRAIDGATRTPPHRCFLRARKSPNEASYWAPIIINRAIVTWFMIDTGFTGSLVIPRDYFDQQRALGSLTTLDPVGPPVTSILADGSETSEPTIIIREIILPACRAIRNVRATISPTGSEPLLGQGILSRFSAVSIDHKRGSLVLVPEGLDP